jgi:hypothetical protein
MDCKQGVETVGTEIPHFVRNDNIYLMQSSPAVYCILLFCPSESDLQEPRIHQVFGTNLFREA